MRTVQTVLTILITLALAFTPAAKADAAYLEDDSEEPPFQGEALESEMPVTVSSASVILCEPESGQILLAKGADDPRPIASVTKVMGILLAMEAVDQGVVSIDDPVSVSQNASGMGGSQVFLDAGETISFGDLLRSMIVSSANDATVAVAEYLCGSQELFVKRMNERARSLGMTNTRFVNATGLPAEGHVSTARDMARAFLELIRHPLYFDYSGIWMEDLVHSDGRVTQLTNTNRLIRMYEGCDGGKTGFTNAAGYCVAATAQRGGMRLICVVLGGETGKLRFSDAASLFDYGFAAWRPYPVAKAGTPVKGALPVRGGDPGAIPLLLGQDLTLLLPKGGEDGVELSAELPESVSAPIDKGDICGAVRVKLNGEEVARIPLLAGGSSRASGILPSLTRLWLRWPAEQGAQ